MCKKPRRRQELDERQSQLVMDEDEGVRHLTAYSEEESKLDLLRNRLQEQVARLPEGSHIRASWQETHDELKTRRDTIHDRAPREPVRAKNELAELEPEHQEALTEIAKVIQAVADATELATQVGLRRKAVKELVAQMKEEEGGVYKGLEQRYEELNVQRKQGRGMINVQPLDALRKLGLVHKALAKLKAELEGERGRRVALGIQIDGEEVALDNRIWPGLDQLHGSRKMEAINTIKGNIHQGQQLVSTILDGRLEDMPKPSRENIAKVTWFLKTMAIQQVGEPFAKGALHLPDPDSKLRRWLDSCQETYNRDSSHLKSQQSEGTGGSNRPRGIDFYEARDSLQRGERPDVDLMLPFGLNSVLFQTYQDEEGNDRLLLKLETEGSLLGNRQSGDVDRPEGRSLRKVDWGRQLRHMANFFRGKSWGGVPEKILRGLGGGGNWELELEDGLGKQNRKERMPKDVLSAYGRVQTAVTGFDQLIALLGEGKWEKEIHVMAENIAAVADLVNHEDDPLEVDEDLEHVNAMLQRLGDAVGEFMDLIRTFMEVEDVRDASFLNRMGQEAVLTTDHLHALALPRDEDDEDEEDDAPERTTAKQLTGKTSRCRLTTAWWQGARGEFRYPKFAQALVALGQARQALRDETSRANFRSVLEKLDTVQRLILVLQNTLRHKSDRGATKRLSERAASYEGIKRKQLEDYEALLPQVRTAFEQYATTSRAPYDEHVLRMDEFFLSVPLGLDRCRAYPLGPGGQPVPENVDDATLMAMVDAGIERGLKLGTRRKDQQRERASAQSTLVGPLADLHALDLDYHPVDQMVHDVNSSIDNLVGLATKAKSALLTLQVTPPLSEAATSDTLDLSKIRQAYKAWDDSLKHITTVNIALQGAIDKVKALADSELEEGELVSQAEELVEQVKEARAGQLTRLKWWRVQPASDLRTTWTDMNPGLEVGGRLTLIKWAAGLGKRKNAPKTPEEKPIYAAFDMCGMLIKLNGVEGGELVSVFEKALAEVAKDWEGGEELIEQAKTALKLPDR